jgi:hypothetical protein
VPSVRVSGNQRLAEEPSDCRNLVISGEAEVGILEARVGNWSDPEQVRFRDRTSQPVHDRNNYVTPFIPSNSLGWTGRH